MAPSAPDPDIPPVSQHLDVLYPLACLLAGPDAAPSLLQRVYERAARELDAEASDSQQARLVRLLVEEHSAASQTTEPDGPSEQDATGSPDSFQQDVAREAAERALPAALAACTPAERFLLALESLEASGDTPDELVGPALDADVPEVRTPPDEARSALWAALGDGLTEPEHSAVEATLSDEALLEMLQTVLLDRFRPFPPSLRAQLRTTLREARHDSDSTTAPSSESSPENTSDGFLTRLRTRLPGGGTARRLALGTGLLVVLTLGGLALLDRDQPTADPPSTVGTLSANHVNTIQPELQTSSPSEAASFVQATWNRDVSPPTIDRAQLQGVGRFRIADSAGVPVFLYQERRDSSRTAVFAYSYALLDRLQSQLAMRTSLRNELAEAHQLVVQQHPDHEVVLWRNRADILAAVTSAPASRPLRPRIQP